MLNAIKRIANSKNRPLAVFMPLSKYSGSLIALPSTIPITNARRISLKPIILLKTKADTAIVKDSKTPFSVLDREEVFILTYCFSSPV